jgi:hypothetical protein
MLLSNLSRVAGGGAQSCAQPGRSDSSAVGRRRARLGRHGTAAGRRADARLCLCMTAELDGEGDTGATSGFTQAEESTSRSVGRSGFCFVPTKGGSRSAGSTAGATMKWKRRAPALTWSIAAPVPMHRLGIVAAPDAAAGRPRRFWWSRRSNQDFRFPDPSQFGPDSCCAGALREPCRPLRSTRPCRMSARHAPAVQTH